MSEIPLDAILFWSKVEIPKARCACWIWTGARKGRDRSYGSYRKVLAHRYAYQSAKGEIPEDQMIRHMCGNKLCVNPSHLEPGTAKENYLDRFTLGEKTGGVGQRGEGNARAKLKDAEVRYIIENPDNMTGNQLAMKFGVSKATISLIRSGRRWSHAA